MLCIGGFKYVLAKCFRLLCCLGCLMSDEFDPSIFSFAGQGIELETVINSLLLTLAPNNSQTPSPLYSSPISHPYANLYSGAVRPSRAV